MSTYVVRNAMANGKLTGIATRSLIAIPAATAMAAWRYTSAVKSSGFWTARSAGDVLSAIGPDLGRLKMRTAHYRQLRPSQDCVGIEVRHFCMRRVESLTRSKVICLFGRIGRASEFVLLTDNSPSHISELLMIG